MITPSKVVEGVFKSPILEQDEDNNAIQNYFNNPISPQKLKYQPDAEKSELEA